MPSAKPVNPVLLTYAEHPTANRRVIAAVPLPAARARHLVALIDEARKLATRKATFRFAVFSDLRLLLFPPRARESVPDSLRLPSRQLTSRNGPCTLFVDAGPGGLDWTPRQVGDVELRVTRDDARWYVEPGGWTWGVETCPVPRRRLLAYLCRVVPQTEVQAVWLELAADDKPLALQVAELGARLHGESAGRAVAQLLRPEDLLPLLSSGAPEIREGAQRLLARVRRGGSATP